MHKILITFDPSFSSDILNDRIRNLGRSFNFYKNQWIVETMLTPKDVYDRLSVGGFENLTIFVIDINSSAYYGRMNTSLWDWMNSQS